MGDGRFSSSLRFLSNGRRATPGRIVSAKRVKRDYREGWALETRRAQKAATRRKLGMKKAG
jgi:hypothetical protein